MYRRTAVLVRSTSAVRRDYVVLLDEFDSPMPVYAQYNAWYVQEDAVADVVQSTKTSATVDLGNSTLFVGNMGVGLGTFLTTRWTNQSEGNELVTGLRFASTRPSGKSNFVSAMYPKGHTATLDGKVPQFQLTGNTLSVSFSDGTDIVEFNDVGASVTLNGISLLHDADVDTNRRQGDVGLALMDAGYDFGPVPEWLLQQRKTEKSYVWPLNAAFTRGEPADLQV